MKRDVPKFATESELCTAFIAALPKEWTAYPETGGFDILLSRNADGFQIGIEAKLRLNAKVICQAAEDVGCSYVDSTGPDCRAVLIPDGVSMDLASLCPLIGITVIRVSHNSYVAAYGGGMNPFNFYPRLPELKDGGWSERVWYERCPVKRIELPDWVPDVRAGSSAPIALTDWKVRAIKIVITLEKRGFVTRKDFAFFSISMSRWMQERWLKQDGKGGWIAGPNLPDFRAQHPVNFVQIEADYEKWKNPTAPATQEALL